MRNPNDDSLLDQVVSLCCLSRYADGRESLCFTVVRICARKLVVRAPLPNHSRTCNAGIDRFTLPILDISLRETARENFGMGERSTEHDTHATFNVPIHTSEQGRWFHENLAELCLFLLLCSNFEESL